MANAPEKGPAELKIGVRQTTYDKFKSLAAESRIPLVELADMAVDQLMISMKGKQTRRKKARAA